MDLSNIEYHRFNDKNSQETELRSSLNEQIITYPVNNLDEFLSNLYLYYRAKGYKNIILKGITDFASLIFTLIISVFFYFIDWRSIRKCDLKEFSCSNTQIFNIKIKHNIFSKIIFIFYIIIFSIYLTWYVISTIMFYYKMYKIKNFYQYSLDINDNNLLFKNFSLIVLSLFRGF